LLETQRRILAREPPADGDELAEPLDTFHFPQGGHDEGLVAGVFPVS
jgi:hypothetical protein